MNERTLTQQHKTTAPMFTPVRSNILQRKCACGQHTVAGGECAACQKKRLQRQVGHQAAPEIAPSIVHEVLRSSGQPLDAATRAYMEPRFGYDFSGVRVHSDARAAESAREVNALAYTVGPHITFGTGQYVPHTSAGQRLLAHELAHVVQQGGWSPGMEIGNTSNNSAEGEAAVIADQVISSKGTIVSQLTHTGPSIQLQPAGGSSSAPANEDVWGFTVTRSMCKCRSRIRDDINWANEARDTYRTCDRSSFTTGAEVEHCFDTAQPGSTVEAETSESGAITLPPPTSDPCDRVHRHAVAVHETFHSRQGNRIARSLGSAFWAKWNRLRGAPDRLDQMRVTFPSEVAEFERQWGAAHEWAQGEVESYTWQRRFLTDVLAALGRICP